MKKCPFCAEEIQDAAIKCRYCGSMLNEPATVGAPVDEFEDVHELARQGKKIRAIKLLREKTGLGLKEAKDFVEHPDLVAGGIPTSVPMLAVPPSVPPPVKKIREFTVLGWPRRDLKDFIHHPAEGPLATIPEPAEPMSFGARVVANRKQARVTKWGDVLSTVLGDDETILDAVDGRYAERVGILVATQKRVIFADDKELKLEFPLDKIVWIQSEGGWLLGSLTIFASDHKAIIENVDKVGGNAFSEGFRESAALGLYGRKLGRPGQKLQVMRPTPLGRRASSFVTALGLLIVTAIVAVPLYFVGGWMLSVYRSPPVDPFSGRPPFSSAKPAPSAPTLVGRGATAPKSSSTPSLTEREAKFQKDLPDLVEQVKQLRQDIRLRQVGDTANTRLSYIKEQLDSITGSTLLVRPDVRKLQQELASSEADLTALGRAIADADPATDITLVRASWSEGGFGVVAIWTVTLKNTNPVMRYSDIGYRTEYRAASGTSVGTGNGKVLDTLKPGQTRRFKVNDGFINGQALRASFKIVDATKEIASPK